MTDLAPADLTRATRLVDAERNRFEDQRVLYVACTRACRRLHLLAAPSVTASGKVSVRSKSFLKLLEEPFQAELEAAAKETERPPTCGRLGFVLSITLALVGRMSSVLTSIALAV